MRRGEVTTRGLWIVLVGAFLAGCASESVAARVEMAPDGAPVRKVSITARKWSFEPEEIEAKQGEILVLTITAQDVKHGFAIDDIDLDVELPPLQPIEVKLYAEKQGVVSFSCSRFCGAGHFFMNGEIIIR